MAVTEATLATFRTQFPEFTETTYADEVVQRAMDEAETLHSVRPLATLFLTAHLLILNDRRKAGTGATGEISMERAGPMQISYVTQAESPGFGLGSREAFYTSTSYGQHFLTLEKRAHRHTIAATVVG